MQDLGGRFKELRMRKGLTSTALAQPRYSVSYISQIERGLRNPSTEALQFFARRLGVTTAYLATGVPDDLAVQLQYEIERARQAVVEDRAGEVEERIFRVIEECEKYCLERLQGSALCVLADALYRLARFREAIDVFERARRLDLTVLDRVKAVSGLARSCRGAGDLKYAGDVIESFLDLEHEPPLESGAIAELQTTLVIIYFERGDTIQAERAAERALAALDDDTPVETRAAACWHASRLSAERGDYDEALELARRARVLMEAAHSRRDAAKLHTAYAFLCLEVEPPRMEEAEAHLADAESMLEELDAPSELTFVLTERSRLAALRGNYRQAARFATQALGVKEAQDLERARALYLQGRAYVGMKNYDRARSAFTKALAIFDSHGAKQQSASCWRELAEIEVALGNHSAAEEAFRAGLHALAPVRSRP
jgi:tetratricopeptide (TPR) repeat protein